MILILLLLLLLFLTCSALASASETALFSLSHLTLKSYRQQPTSSRKRLLVSLLEKPRDLLVMLLIGNSLANLLIQNTISSLFGSFSHWIVRVAVPLAVVLIIGDIIPKSFAMSSNEKISLWIVPFWSRVTRWGAPLRRPLIKMTEWLSRVLFSFLPKEKALSAEELHHLLQSSEKRGVLLSEECDLIEGSLYLQSCLVKEKMRPRGEILFFDYSDPLENLIHLMSDLAITRVPVCDGDLDHLLGICHIRDFLLHREKIGEGKDLLPFLHKPFYVPESSRSWKLLQQLWKSGESLAMVIDEYGSIAGLITREDLVETVVGEISDIRDVEKDYTRSGEDVIIASGQMELSEFREIFDIPITSKGNIVTLGGWLVEQLGDIPSVGTKYATDQFLFYVLEAEPNRIRRIYVRKLYPK
ncbi:MAG: HlyC/CorC family transporter [Verrucomicrobiota bacterium]|nr:HlyC/CorC family transporter [Verrucomicrobiota bacterium]